MRAYRLAVPSSDLAVSRRFYETVLDLEADDTVPTRIYFHCDGFILAVIDWSSAAAREQRGPVRPLPDNLYLATDDLDAVFARVQAAGGQILAPIQEQPWGERSFYCLDPDGHPLCFVDDTTLFLGRGAAWA